MARLTAQEVHTKNFKIVKFREGFDCDEVDDYLDEVVNSMYELENENAELKAQLEIAQNRVAELEAGGAVAVPAAPAEGAQGEDRSAEVAQLQAELQAANAKVAELENENANTRAALDDARSEAEVAAARLEEQKQVPLQAAESGNASSVLALAQRVHDEYVRDGQAEGNRIIEEARAQGAQIVREAEEHRDQIVSDMETKRDELQGRIDELRSFESEYRDKLSGHLQDLLNHVQN